MIKTFETYEDSKKIEIINKFILYMNKYEINKFYIGLPLNNNEANINLIHKTKENKFKLRYTLIDNYNYIEYDEELYHLTYSFINSIYELCKNQSGRIEYQLSHTDFDNFINILKNCKRNIKFNEKMFVSNKMNDFKFQNILFKTHPEAYNVFLDKCFNSNLYIHLYIHPDILIKYDDLLGDYYEQKLQEQKVKKYNL